MGKRKLLVIENKGLDKDQLGSRLNRTRIIKALSASGAKVLHDSGGRLIIIDVPEATEKIFLKDITGVKLISIEPDMKDEIPDLSPDESLFLSAVKKRNTKKYREAKNLRKPGETPEEKELLKGSCIREEL